MLSTTEAGAAVLHASQIEDLKLASSKMTAARRRAFQAAMTLKYCRGSARQAERVFGWNRDTVELGLHELRTGVICLGAQAAFCGSRLWEEQYPQAAQALWALAEGHGQQDPTFRTVLSYTRLTAAEALQQLRAQGFPEEQLPSPSTMAEVLNRNGYRLRKVVKAKPQKNSRKQTPSSPTSRKRMASPSHQKTSTRRHRSSA
jgi:biotin operon repressor